MYYMINVTLDIYNTNVYNLEISDNQELIRFMRKIFDNSDFYGFICFYAYQNEKEVVEDIYLGSDIPQFVERILLCGIEMDATITTKYHGIDIILQFEYYPRLAAYVMTVSLDNNIESQVADDIFGIFEQV